MSLAEELFLEFTGKNLPGFLTVYCTPHYICVGDKKRMVMFAEINHHGTFFHTEIPEYIHSIYEKLGIEEAVIHLYQEENGKVKKR